MNRFILLFFMVFLCATAVFAQKEVLDSFENALSKVEGVEKIKVLQSLSDYYLDNSLNKSIEYANMALKLSDEIGNDTYKANLYGQLGEAYFYMDDIATAEKYFGIVLEIRKKQNKPELLASALNNMGIILRYQEKYEQALENYEQALKINKELNDTAGIANMINNIGVLNEYLGNYKRALEQYHECMPYYSELNDLEGIATAYLNIGALHRIMGEPEKAIENCQRSVEISDSNNYLVVLEMDYEELYKSYKMLDNYSESLEYHEKFVNLKSLRINKDNLEQIAELEVQYKTAEKEKAIALLNEEKSRQRMLIFIMIGGLAGLIIIVVLVIRINKTKKRANDKLRSLNAEITQQNEEIQAQRDELDRASKIIIKQRDHAIEQREIVAQQKQDITDSIQYARKIQTATLPSRDLFRDVFSDYFIINRPRDIVSGDFYWMVRRDNAIVFTVADCTGHGVPGALMSVLGISLLNEVVGNMKKMQASLILDLLRIRLIQALHQSTQKQKTRDGIEMALCVYYVDSQTLEFSGSYSSLYHLRNNQLKEYKADRMPIGLYHNRVGKFSNQLISLNKKDRIFLSSDGYVDQMGGEKDRKFLKANFKKLLAESAPLNIAEQGNKIDKVFLDWKGDFTQIDDIMVLGVEI